MSFIFQMPQFFVRGSLANETMKHYMTKQQREETGQIAMDLMKRPQMVQYVNNFCKTLKNTIKGDYLDREASLADCLIAIERGVCLLLYHHHYTFKCSKCGSTTYISKGRKTPRPISSRKQKYDQCPNCLQTGDKPNTSPIDAMMGEKYFPGDTGHKILNDPEQIYKFLNKLLKNNNLQQLRENPLKSTKRTVRMTNLADQVIMAELEKVLRRFKMTIKKSVICAGNGGYESNGLDFEVNAVPSECIGQIISLQRKAIDNNVKFKATNTGIELSRTNSTTTITTMVDEKTTIRMMTESQGPDETGNPLEVPGSETNHVSTIESRDSLAAVIERLPSEDCVDILQIYSGIGPAYKEYIMWFGSESKITQKNISDQLGLTKAEFSMCKNQIRAVCTELGLDPIGDRRRNRD